MVSKNNEYSLAMAQSHHLNKGQKWQIIGRTEGSQTQINVGQDLNIIQNVISRA